MKTLIGQKKGMTQYFSDDGTVSAVTVIEVRPCIITQLKNVDKDGYCSVQLGTGKSRKLNKAQQGHLKDLGNFSILREIRVEDSSGYELGQQIDLSVFEKVKKVDVSGISKGKGFAGTVKRYHFNRGPTTHGHDHHRQVGSIGAGTDPGRVFKGKRMPGRMGNETVTQIGLKVIKNDPDKQVILVDGSVPGSKGDYVIVRESIKS